jgi:ubiquinone/menaquinone biosynthesis C-methylase UbiE
MKRFTEDVTESFYDSEDELYRSFWDTEGSLHWGLFDESTGQDFLKACANLNEFMANKARLLPDSSLLDIGCGNGNTAMWLSSTRECSVVGVDLSGVRITNAIQSLEGAPAPLRDRVRFEKASATALPFGDGSFSHVWSQATIYHIPDKEATLREAYRVLADGGLFIFDDLIKPKPDISEAARTYVYDRLYFDTDFSFQSYQDALKDTGFRVLEALDLSEHLGASYTHLANVTRELSESHDEKYKDLAYAYGQMVKAQENSELGWAFYLCEK